MKVIKKKVVVPAKAVASGPASKYDWKKLFDGQQYVMVRGEDYPAPGLDEAGEPKKDKFINVVKKTALKHHVNVETCFIDANDQPCGVAGSVGVFIRATPMNDEQIADADATIAKAKESKTKRKAEKKAAELNGQTATEVVEQPVAASA